MNESNSGGAAAAEENRAKPAGNPPIRYNFGAMLKENPGIYRVLELATVNPRYLGLSLRALASFGFGHLSQFIFIDCVNVVDYSIRPPNPATLMGGPPMEFYEQHQRLESVSRCVPNTDGMKVFDPSVVFHLLVIDQSYIIAQQFVLRIENDNIFKDATGIDDAQKQQFAKDLKRGLDCIEKFRLPDGKK